jgi:hypothetical protein
VLDPKRDAKFRPDGSLPAGHAVHSPTICSANSSALVIGRIDVSMFEKLWKPEMQISIIHDQKSTDSGRQEQESIQ